jgi:hypothetical protein
MASTLILGAYKNTVSVGATGFACGASSPSAVPPCITVGSPLGNFTVVPKKTGSAIVGGFSIESGNDCVTNKITAGANQTQKGQVCVPSPDFFQSDFEDNLPASYLNGFQYFYSSTASVPNFPTMEWTIQAIELKPSLFNGINSNVAPPVQCTKANQLCNLVMANKISGIQTTATIALNTEYCTGITTSGLVLNVTSNILFTSMYGADDRNVTNAIVRVILYYSTTVPSTTFGSGGCATGTEVAESRLQFATTGTGTATSIFALYSSMNAVVSIASGTIYAFIDIIPLTSGMLYFQFGQAPFSRLSMTLESGK